MPAVERVRQALEDHGCQTRGPAGKFRAQCPVHEGTSLSLSVSQGRERALVHCFPGCDTRDVVDAIGLTMDDLFDVPRDRRSTTPVRKARPADPFADLKRVLERAVSIMNLRTAQDTYREFCPMPLPSVDERIDLAIWAEKEDQDAHYWRVLARRAALACDEEYVRKAYQQRAKWLRTRDPNDQPSWEQDMVLLTRAEDLRNARKAAA